MSFIYSGQRITSLALEPVISANIAKPSAISGPVEGVLYNDGTQKSIGKMIGGLGVFGHEVANINVTPVTGPSNTTTETAMMSFAFPSGPGWLNTNAGPLNAATKTLHVFASGLANTITAASTITFKIRLGGVVGPPPTGNTLLTMVTTTTTIGLTNAVWALDSYITIQAGNASGGTGTFEAHGYAGLPLAAAAGVISWFGDANTATVTGPDLSVAQTLFVTAALGTGGASNNISQRQLIVEVLN